MTDAKTCTQFLTRIKIFWLRLVRYMGHIENVERSLSYPSFSLFLTKRGNYF